MIILGLIFTIFKSSIIFGGSWGSIENWLEPKTKPPTRNSLLRQSFSYRIEPSLKAANVQCGEYSSYCS